MSDWIEWNGGECPVPGDTIVEYRSRGGDSGVCEAEYFLWDHISDSSDIVAYRIVGDA